MSKIIYDGYELEYFDDAYNFRKYQIQLIKKYLQKNLAEVGPGKGGLVGYYKKFVKKIYLIEPDRNLYQLIKKRKALCARNHKKGGRTATKRAN